MTARKPLQLSGKALMRIIMAALQEERIKGTSKNSSRQVAANLTR